MAITELDVSIHIRLKHPRRNPNTKLPQSPRKMEAGLKLKTKNPINAPASGRSRYSQFRVAAHDRSDQYGCCS